MGKKGKRKLIQKLKHKYRLIIRDENSLEEKLSFRLTRFNVIFLLSFIIIVVSFAVFSLISFTPLREYIPGYADFETKKEMAFLVNKTDSLEKIVGQQEFYFTNLRKILSGDIDDYAEDAYEKDESMEITSSIDFTSRSVEDSLLRLEFEQEDAYNLLFTDKVAEDQLLKNIMFFPPVRGIITNHFNPAEGHPAVDIASAPNIGIKAVLDGTVIYSDWNIYNGFVIILQHKNNLVSAYKHNSVLLKKVGNFVKAGEVIAIIGETGELSQGAHLHFELWYDGSPLDPEKFIAF